MRARLVTAYVPIIDHPRKSSEYGELGEKLSGVPVRKKAFYQEVGSTWLAQYLRLLPHAPRWSVGDNPEKNSLAYHCVQHEKFSWLAQAAREYDDDDIFVWVDYGIFHQPGVCNEAIVKFMESLDDAAIYIPGCWDQQHTIYPDSPNWRFCGSTFAVPRRYVTALDDEMRALVKRRVGFTNNVEWEVNNLARLEKETALPIRWYKADHDVTQFTNVPTIKGNARYVVPA